MIFLGSDVYLEKVFPGFIGNGISADQFQDRVEATINREVVSGQLNGGLLSRVYKGDIGRADPGFDKQRVVGRYDFNQVHTRLDNGAWRIDQDLINRTIDG